ncbi:MAG: energy-coupling factor transporter transmembrane protein EcfT [Anaerolineaceae bacterium]|jgi:energy-coupling factor transport system permease protein|nr:energy-coupling factor transporter transmembrane protein EcfT [Anaerolineaceae bacterium]
MSNFEFMQRMTFGQYLPTGSVLHRLDARARIVIFTAFLTAVTVAKGLPGLVLSLLLAVIGLLLARIPLGYALKGLLPPLPFLVILAVIQVLMRSRGTEAALFQFWLLRVTAGGLLEGVILLVRFASLVLWLSLTSFTLSVSELILGLNLLLRPLRRLRLPVDDLVLMVQVTVRFIPFLTQSAERIVKAQASRGAAWGQGSGGVLRRVRQALPMIVPLFLNSLRRAENLALAMDARGYGGNAARTSMHELNFQVVDWLAVGGSLLLAGLMVVWGVVI